MSASNADNKGDVKCYVEIINYSPLKTEGLMQVIKGKTAGSPETSVQYFYFFLTVHPNKMIVFFYHLHAQILHFNIFITFLYMFRALLCSSSGE